MATRPKLRRRRRTKIIATLGPASSSPEVLTRLFQAGADVFRLNFSHGTHEDHAARFAMIRQLEDRFDTIIIQGVLEQDTQVYAFTNGQLVFDRGVRLGGLIVNRYQIETGNGFETDSVRIVLTE